MLHHIFIFIQQALGTPKAITATAHKLARIFYRLWTSGGNYQDPGMDYYEQRYQQREALLHETEKWPHPYLKEIGELVFHFVAIRFTQLNHAIKGSALQEQLDGLSIKSSSS